MKVFITRWLLWLLPCLLQVYQTATAQAPASTPLEIQRDLLQEKRFMVSLAALREPDEAKTLAMLRAMAKEYTAAMEKLRPAYQHWYATLSRKQRMQLLQQEEHKQWMLLMQEIQFDEKIRQRFKAHDTLKREYENIQFQCDRAAEIQPPD